MSSILSNKDTTFIPYWYAICSLVSTSDWQYNLISLATMVSIMRYMNRKYGTKNIGKTFLVVCDPEEDADDEIAIISLLRKIQLLKQGFESVTILTVPGDPAKGISSKKRLISLQKIIVKTFPQFGGKNNFCIEETEIRLSTIENLKINNDCYYDIFLQIAPLIGTGNEWLKNITFGHRVIMGDIDNPDNSLNLSKLIGNNLVNRKEFDAQENEMAKVKTTSITTDLGRSVPITYKFYQSLPTCLQDIVIEMSFKFLVGRVPSSSIHCFPVTTIPNKKTAIGYLSKDAEMQIKATSSQLRKVTYKFINEFVEEAQKTADLHNKFFDFNTMYQAMVDIAAVVYIITGCEYKNSKFAVSSLEDSTLAEAEFKQYVLTKKCDLIPAYDAVAMEFALNLDEFNEEKYDKCYTEVMKKRLGM